MRDWLNDETPLIERLWQRCDAEPERAALWTRENQTWRARTWHEIAGDVRRAVDMLARHGVDTGWVVSHVGPNSYDWIVADLALLALGAVHVPLHASLGPTQWSSQIAHSGSRLILDSRDSTQFSPRGTALAASERQLEVGENAHVPSETTPWLAWRDFWRLGNGERGSEVIAAARRSRASGVPATILYTSGTLGAPKGVVLGQENLLANTLSVLQAFVERETERRLCVLPFSHIYARTCDLYVWLASGTEMALATRPDALRDECREIQPTLINGVPLLFERIHRQLIEAGVAERPGVLRAVLGGRIELCICGGAPVGDELYEFFERQEVPLLPGYGLTEASPVVTASTLGCRSASCVGGPVPGVEVRITSEGEILARGRNVMLGYHADEGATREALRDGWLHTGDLGEWSDQGLLRITGRKKEILVLSTGKNVSPSEIERRLTSRAPLVQACVVGDAHPCLVALGVLHPAAAESWRKVHGEKGATVLEMDQPESPREAIAAAVRVACGELAPHEQIRALVLLAEPFSQDRGEITPKFTQCRPRIVERYAHTIDRAFDRLQRVPHRDTGPLVWAIDELTD